MKRPLPSLLLLTLLSGCASHAASGVRSHGVAVADRSGDGWQKTEKVGKKSAKSSAKEPATKAPAKPASTPMRVAAVAKDPVPAAPASRDLRAEAVANGKAILAGTSPKPKQQDCSGFVKTAYERAGYALEVKPEHQQGTRSLAEMLYRQAKAEGRSHKETPKPGDLAFFKNTYGAMDGRVTHVAMVESVAGDGTVTLIHHMGGRYRRSPMNLGIPHEPLKNGYFRKRTTQSANEPVLAGELFVAYARPV